MEKVHLTRIDDRLRREGTLNRRYDTLKESRTLFLRVKWLAILRQHSVTLFHILAVVVERRGGETAAVVGDCGGGAVLVER